MPSKLFIKLISIEFIFICLCFYSQRNSDQLLKKVKIDLEIHTDDTLFELLHAPKGKTATNIEAQEVNNGPNFTNCLMQPIPELEDDEEEEVPKTKPKLPFDWTVKSRLRILSKNPIPGNNLKSSQEASGMTGFVRCLDIKNNSSGLDISSGARFHQNMMYWQYPHLPWLNLVQRNVRSNNTFKMGKEESESLLTDWIINFRNLFQLLRARQCPYFYVFANTFSVLFRAAGIGGRSEVHAFLTPTTRGLRQLLKKEDIEYTLPLKAQTVKETTPNTSATSCSLQDCIPNENDSEQEDDDMDEVKFLESLGVDGDDIKRINFKENRKGEMKDTEDDFGDQSTAFVEGSECQAFFNFLLNAKSTVPKIGKLAGIPPTLIAPVAFLGGTLRKQTLRTSKIRIEQEDYFSVELKGVILPHTPHTLCELLTEIKDCFSFTMSSYAHTVAFTKTSKKLLDDLNNSQAVADHVFGRENLSDCGFSNELLEKMCTVEEDAVTIIDRLSYSKEAGGYIYS